MAEKTFEGITYSDKYLSVHWKQKYGGTVRFETLKIAWETLAADETFQDHLGHAVARYMNKIWGMTTEENPLF